MAFNATGFAHEFHMLAEISLNNTIIRVADEDISIHVSNATGYFFEGRVVGGGQIRRSLGNMLEGKEVLDTYPLSVDNSDLVPQDWIKNYDFRNKRTKIWVGAGKNLSDYEIKMDGRVVFPAGISWDERLATFTIADRRIRERRNLPPAGDIWHPTKNFFFQNMEAKSVGKFRPVVYGDWSTNAEGGNIIKVPTAAIDEISFNFQIAGHGLKQIERIFKNAVEFSLDDTSQILNYDETDATFQFHWLQLYDPQTEIVTANVQGHQTINGTLIENPIDVLKHIQTAYQGLTSTDLDVTAYHTASQILRNVKVRRFIDSTTNTEELISELLLESNVDLRFVGGKYSPKVRSLEPETETLPVFHDFDILTDAEDVAQFSVDRDQDRVFANSFRSQFQFDPTNALYRQEYSNQATATVAEVGEIEREMTFNWLYRKEDVRARVQQEIILFSEESDNVQFNAGPRMLKQNLADQIQLTFNIYEKKPLQIRQADVDLNNFSTRVRAYDIKDLQLGLWNESASSWSSELTYLGFWSDDSGFASPSDSSSFNVSRWA